MEAGRKFITKFKYRDIFDGNRHELVQGVDFEGDCKRLQNSIIASARYYKVRVQTSCFDGSLFVRSFSLSLKSAEEEVAKQASSVE